MKKVCLILVPLFLWPSILEAESAQLNLAREIQSQLDHPETLVAKRSKRKRARRKRARRSRKQQNRLQKAFKLARQKRYQESSILLYKLSRGSRYKKDHSHIKYILGLTLMKLGLYQVSSFVFYDVIRSEIRSKRTSKFLRQSLNKLSFLSNALDSDVLLKHIIDRIEIKDFPREQKDLFYYRLGEVRLKEKRYDQAARIFQRVNPGSPVYSKALYKTGLAYSYARKGSKALAAFDELLQAANRRGRVTDDNRVNALLSMARVYYQNKNWGRAIEYYRLIPRDTWQWHDSLFEQSWAMLRSGRYFRSALSNFHTLHSSYYEDRYAPESLLVRAMVYLFICRYDEMGKVLNLFDSVYRPVSSKVRRFSRASSNLFLDEILKADANKKAIRNKEKKRFTNRLPNIVLNEILNKPNIRGNLKYIKALREETSKMSLLSTVWKSSGVGRYAKRVLDKRVRSTQNLIGRQARNHLRRIQSELKDFFEQSDFLKFEMVSAKKESLRKKISGKGVARNQITENESRDYFIANGYEYWPYQGEYWLDELGNYHYVGVQACE